MKRFSGIFIYIIQKREKYFQRKSQRNEKQNDKLTIMKIRMIDFPAIYVKRQT
jgi:hypothetical protein